ncbi:MAG TPA: Dyp-type peroxidase [Pyrinomonadaceae bacterium]|nr:Dyp-type peroxidase [Pyrinomonadaceae bacterium]
MRRRATDVGGRGAPVGASSPATPVSRDNEPILDADDIQGNILGGFAKQFQSVLFLKICNISAFKRWLLPLKPRITSSAEVIACKHNPAHQFGEQYQTAQGQTKTWINIAFSYNALNRLVGSGNHFADEAFQQGLAKRSVLLGDPISPQAEGNPQNWVVGGPNNEADAVLILRTQNLRELFSEVALIKKGLGDNAARRLPVAARVIFTQHGYPSAPVGHEHFGFRDEISQPGIRGYLPSGELLTPCENPQDANHGKPGQQLIWPGEFVFGYPGQNPHAGLDVPGKDPLMGAAPAWAKNGSFLVIRRLRQDVYKFHSFLKETGRKLGIAPRLVGAKLLGRWASGTPLSAAPRTDNEVLGEDAYTNNNFTFQRTPPSANDGGDGHCPRSAHIRQIHPRDIRSHCGATFPNISDTQTHRILRRGIPYGSASQSTPERPIKDAIDRGLLFLAYQTSIQRQFEFIIRRWANETNFPEPLSGHDPIIGQNNVTSDRRRTFGILEGPNGTVTTRREWVIPTGGGYFFSPSISALEIISK